MSDELSSLDPNLQWIAAEARRPVVLDAGARTRLLEALREEPRPRRPNAFTWLVEPRQFSLPPLATMAMAAGLAGMGLVSGYLLNRVGRAPTEQGHPVSAVSQAPGSSRVVKFVLAAPQAARVSLVGDFNGWDTSATPAVREPDGTWTMFVSLRPGRHVYSFVVDGAHFVNDPAAPVDPDDGFGQRNSVVVVRATS
jgi:hypothetical protein